MKTGEEILKEFECIFDGKKKDYIVTLVIGIRRKKENKREAIMEELERLLGDEK